MIVAMAVVTTFFLKKYRKDSHVFADKTAVLNEMMCKLKLENKSLFGRNNKSTFMKSYHSHTRL